MRTLTRIYRRIWLFAMEHQHQVEHLLHVCHIVHLYLH